MSKKELETELIDTVFNLEVKFNEIGTMFKDLGRLLLELKKAEGS